MRRVFRSTAIFAALACAAFVLPSAADAFESHADGSSTTQPAACKVAQMLARQGVASERVTAAHCECLENKDDRAAPWSCTAFVSYR